MQLTAVYRKVPEGYVAFVEKLPVANTQGASLDEARANLVEAVDWVLAAYSDENDRCFRMKVTADSDGR